MTLLIPETRGCLLTSSIFLTLAAPIAVAIIERRAMRRMVRDVVMLISLPDTRQQQYNNVSLKTGGCLSPSQLEEVPGQKLVHPLHWGQSYKGGPPPKHSAKVWRKHRLSVENHWSTFICLGLKSLPVPFTSFHFNATYCWPSQHIIYLTYTNLFNKFDSKQF